MRLVVSRLFFCARSLKYGVAIRNFWTDLREARETARVRMLQDMLSGRHGYYDYVDWVLEFFAKVWGIKLEKWMFLK